jgi:myo-inositol-1(or 4)-monophosphatase
MVSDADRDAEATVEEILLGERPDDGIMAEEGASSNSASGRRWVVDPLDGTTNYLYRFPAWAVSIALEESGESVLGVVHDPVRSETFTALRGEGAWLNGEPIEVNECEALETALVATGFGYDAERRAAQGEVLLRVLPRVRDIRRAGAASLDLCWLAAGRLDGYYERGLQPWDWAAASVVATEAGAALTELEGEPSGLVAAGPSIADELVELVT